MFAFFHLLLLPQGNETTGLTLAFTILMLAMHPNIQEKVYQEIQSNDGSGEPTYDTLSHLTYMEMVIKETLRHFAVGPVVGRKATANVKLSKTSSLQEFQIQFFTPQRNTPSQKEPN